MKSLPKVLLFGLLGTLGFAGFVLLLTMTVTYVPYGVPESRREEYTAKITEIKQYAELAKQADPSVSPVVKVEQTSFHFGMVDPHSTLSHDFVIRNEGALPLKLDVRETSCKCTMGKLASRLLLPGEQSSVTMTWNTGYQVDSYEQTATLTTNDPLAKEITLKVSGEVRAECIAPKSIAFDTSDAGHPGETSYYVFSQLWEDFEVAKLETDLKGFQWTAEPVSPDDIYLLDREAKSAWKVNVSSLGNKRGPFTGKITMTINPIDGSKPVIKEMKATGKVRAPINFYSPDIHSDEGLDIGTLQSGKEYLFHLIVRGRSDQPRKIEVLDVKPDELQAEIQPMSQPNSYRLTLRVPKDCPLVVFNADAAHGYVQVGDPDDESFSNWFPVMGAVVTTDSVARAAGASHQSLESQITAKRKEHDGSR